jgi:2-polyprenyl-3-methyl-5-hydroxy-6-metoxy-1,4-benzoquinol methylase
MKKRWAGFNGKERLSFWAAFCFTIFLSLPLMLSVYKYQYFLSCNFCGGSDFTNKGRNGTGDTFHKQVVQCDNCGLLFVNPIADEQSMRLYYASYGDEYPQPLEIPAKFYAEAEHAINQFPNTIGPLRFLDVGANTGMLVQAFQERGWEAHGIELSSSSVRFAREKRGLTTMKEGEIIDVDYPEGYFDYILFWHVIEHLRNPVDVLRKIHYWLKPGGVLRLGMPNPSPLLSVMLSKYHGRFSLGADHTFGFPKQTTKRILNEIGFSIFRHEIYTSPSGKKGFKGTIRNVLDKVTPRFVSYFQVADARKK